MKSNWPSEAIFIKLQPNMTNKRKKTCPHFIARFHKRRAIIIKKNNNRAVIVCRQIDLSDRLKHTQAHACRVCVPLRTRSTVAIAK